MVVHDCSHIIAGNFEAHQALLSNDRVKSIPEYTTMKMSRHYIALVAKSQTIILKFPDLECVDVLQDVQSVEFVDDRTDDTLMYVQHNKVHLYHLHYRFHDVVMEISGDVMLHPRGFVEHGCNNLVGIHTFL